MAWLDHMTKEWLNLIWLVFIAYCLTLQYFGRGKFFKSQRIEKSLLCLFLVARLCVIPLDLLQFHYPTICVHKGNHFFSYRSYPFFSY